jgi:tetratricopeptide (TPR) repeat protein
MNIIRKARGSEISRQAQRVFLYVDEKNNADAYALADDLLSQDAGMDCVVSWIEPGSEVDEYALRNELKETQAFVLWVTAELLISARENGIPPKYAIAKEMGTPIFPIAHDDKLLPLFTEIFGKMHGISKLDNEYRAKLRSQLENFLVSDELREEIDAHAFTAEIFLSYRKIDLDEARRFMNELHDVDGLQGISIWYDNFLTVGKAFDEEIHSAITRSNAFVLLVTPNITKKNDFGEPNYVVREETPFAVNKQKPIIPLETEPQDRATFAMAFPDVGEPIPKSAIDTAFRAKLGDTAYIGKLGSARAYCLGTAYLRGYRVERDVARAVKLLETAAAENCEMGYRAATLLGEIYSGGGVVGSNYNEALRWQRRAAEISEIFFGAKHPNTAQSYKNITLTYFKQGNYRDAIEWGQKAVSRFMDIEGQDNYFGRIALYNCLADSYDKLKDLEKAFHFCQMVSECYKENDSIPNAYNHTVIDSKLLEAQIMSTYGFSAYDYDQALGIVENELNTCIEILGESHPDTAYCYDCLAKYQRNTDMRQAEESFKKAIALCETLYGSCHSETADYYDNLAHTVYAREEDYQTALVWHEKALDARKKLYGDCHERVYISLVNIGSTHHNAGQFEEAIKYYEDALSVGETVYGIDSPNLIVLYKNFRKTILGLKLYHLDKYRDEGIPYRDAFRELGKKDKDAKAKAKRAKKSLSRQRKASRE